MCSHQAGFVVGIVEDDVTDRVGEHGAFQRHQLIAAIAQSWKWKKKLMWRIGCTFNNGAGGPGFESHPGWHFTSSSRLPADSKAFSCITIVTCNYSWLLK